jgi:membrane protein DedA with SNARE-associated domain
VLSELPFYENLASLAPGLYLVLFLAPFLQEDAAVIGAAAASAAGEGRPIAIFLAVLLGLTVSDVWKYWVGRASHRWAWAKRAAATARVANVADQVSRRLGAALTIARFIPGTRIPLYIACGYFRLSFARFAALIVVSGALYIGVAFAAAYGLGALLGNGGINSLHFLLPPGAG